ncbi:hypothetical protein P0136_02500 [Lentisphaerota bacterium ZTH]|nr:hypothetical protein JYG24_06360 [Lentisphaerota bacterium]WET06872.1 hypothetical protein P0136_02500 [Lentisphaerota bacterium ZTH]
MKYKVVYMYKLISCFTLICAASAAFAQGGQTVLKGIKQSIGKQVVAEQQTEVKADNFFKHGNKLLLDNKYKEAIDSYIHAVETFRKINGGQAEAIKRKIKACQEQVYKAYSYWATDLAQQAEDNANAKEYDEAITLTEKAIAIYPPSRSRLEKNIKRYKRYKAALERKDEVALNKLIPNLEKQKYDIDVLMRQARALIRENRLDRAKEKYEQVLLLDPYNSEANQGLRSVSFRINDAGVHRSYNLNKERMAEVEWKYATPIVPESVVGNKDILDGAVSKSSVTNKLKEKLKSIIIDKINFEDFPLPTAVNYLRVQSKKLDPEGKGVNIFLRITPTGDEVSGNKIKAGEEVSASDEEDMDEDSEDVDLSRYPIVNLLLSKKSLYEAIALLCENAQLNFAVEQYSVVIFSKDIPIEGVETKIFPVKQRSLSAIGGGEDKEALIRHFQSRGITFPKGADMVYDAGISRLFATNTVENLQKIESIIQNELNAKNPMVQIQAKFVEIEQNDLKELGFDWVISSSSTDPGTANGQLQMDANNTLVRTIAPQLDTMFVYNRSVNGFNFNFTIRALNQADSKNLLSAPRITTTDGKEASIRMVREVYFPDDYTEAKLTTTSGGNQANTQYFSYVSAIPEFSDPKELGIILRVTPQVDINRRVITMRMNPTVQSLVDWTKYEYDVSVGGDSGGGKPLKRTEKILKPIIAARTIDTQISINDGEYIVIGGIIRDNTRIIEDKVPILGEIPLIGRAFQSRSTQSEKINLLIFLHCKLVKPDGTAFFPDVREKGLADFKRLK